MKLKNLLLPGAIIVLFAVVYHLLSDYTLAALVLPEVKSMKKPGTKCKPTDTFSVGNKIYAKGIHLFPNTQVKIYIVAQDDRCLWKFGDSIGTDVSGGAETVTTTARGKFSCKEIWGSAASGNYDIVVDANQNGIYDSGDAVDSITVGTGFTAGTQPTVFLLGLADTDGDGTPETACLERKYFFPRTDDVYAEGEGFPASTDVDIYVKLNQGWNFGDSIGADDGDGAAVTVTTTVDDLGTTDEDEGGRLPCTLIWDHTATGGTLTGGEFDVVVDVDQDGYYTAGDAVYNRCFETPITPGESLTGAGFFVQTTTTTTTTSTTTSTTTTTTTSTTTTTV